MRRSGHDAQGLRGRTGTAGRIWQEAAQEARRRLIPVLYRQPIVALQPERLYAFLDALWTRREVGGSVVEVGCYLAGSAVIAHRMLKRTGAQRPYVCIDTFAGFVPEQFDQDVRHGTPERLRASFTHNSLDFVSALLRFHGCDDIQLCEGDIATLPDERIPERIAVCLVDVDLEVPVYEALRRVVPRVAPGGIVLVDDCPEGTDWAGARIGYRRFVRESGLPEQYRMGMGIVEIPACAG